MPDTQSLVDGNAAATRAGRARPPLRRAARPPGPAGLPWLGTTLASNRDPLRWVCELGHGYGPISSTRFGPIRVYLVNDPELIESVLVGQHRDCIKDSWQRELSSLVGNGLLTSEGERWRHHRRLAAPALQPKRIANYAATMVECTDRFFARFANRERRRIEVDMSALTLEIAGKTLLGFDASGQTERVATILHAAGEHLTRQLYSFQAILPRWVPTPTRLRYRAAVSELDGMLYDIVRRCRSEAEPADHFLARLVAARSEDGQALTDVELRDEAVTMLLAGHETTALTLSFACHALATHPQVAAAVREEVDGVLGTRAVEFGDLPRMPLLDAVLRETLRLYPPAYLLGREVVNGFELGGYNVPVGTDLMMSPFSVHRDPRLHPEPERFDPERWLAPRAHALHRFAYFPFGGGPRVCIGSHFALLESAIVLAMLVQRFELEAVPGFALQLRPSVTLRPGTAGVQVELRRRSLPGR